MVKNGADLRGKNFEWGRIREINKGDGFNNNKIKIFLKRLNSQECDLDPEVTSNMLLFPGGHILVS